LQQELPIPATGFAFYYEAHLPWMLLQQGQSEPSEPSHVLRSEAISGLQSIVVRLVKASHQERPDAVAFVSRFFRHFLLQDFTSSQTFFHFLRHENGLSQTTHVFAGRLDFWWGIATYL
jgi:hypothetical protein